MNIVLISECNKAALKETRRILDQFAERRGERTWQTAITLEGLKTLRRLLRKTARKNTAVACHWIRGLNHSELLWVVGNNNSFNAQGAVPTNFTQRNILRLVDENDWRTGDLIYLLSSLASLLHDLGKACDAFQHRLLGQTAFEKNIYRHEWVSVRLFQAFVGKDSDAQWLERLVNFEGYTEQDWLAHLQKDGLDTKTDKPFAQLPPLAAALAWLVLTHHRLPDLPDKEQGIQAEQFANYFKQIDAQWNEPCFEKDKKKIKPYWSFTNNLPVINIKWKKRAARIAKRLLPYQQSAINENPLNNVYLMHMARLSLMLADHHYSSLSDPAQRIEHKNTTALYANTNRATGQLNQSLEEHLVGVAINAGYVTHSLPDLERSLPTLKNHKGLRQRSTLARFRWQDKAADLAVGIRAQSEQHGAFIVNMASTGCGKTLANARIMYALADPQKGARFSVALGLRTLTLQTGRAYREDKMYLDEEQMAIRVGGSASRDLFDFHQQQAAKFGSESVQDLMDEDGGVLFEGNYDAHPLLQRTLHKPDIKSLIAAPVLVCTVDHLTPATESLRGGRQIAPMLRLMTSDLVLDEIDDYGLEDLPALARLVYWVGLLGARVMLSSATLPPALVQGLFSAYLAGREQYQNNRGEPHTKLNISCAWIDEHGVSSSSCSTVELFQQKHEQFAQNRANKLADLVAKQQVRRTSEIVAVDHLGVNKTQIYQAFSKRIIASALELHVKNHTQDPATHKRVSFGLVRMANIGPLVEVALAIAQTKLADGYQLHICVYHSQYPLLLRSAIEHELDNSLDRRELNQVFARPRVRHALDNSTADNHLFVVLGSPVTEVGRDHDYDWAVVEPSSMRSLIQLVGRVRRHRPESYLETNIHILEENVKSRLRPQEPAFTRPGFEDKKERLSSKLVSQLLEEQQWRVIDSRPRIIEKTNLDQKNSLVDIEHYQLQQKMLPQYDLSISDLPEWMRDETDDAVPVPRLGAHSWWTAPYATLMTILQKAQPFRDDAGERRADLVLLLNQDGDDYALHELVQAKRGELATYVLVDESKLQRRTDFLTGNQSVALWIAEDYLEQLEAYAQQLDMSEVSCAKRYGVVSVRESETGWCFHAALGFTVNKG